jgi:hypothetical protein
MSSSNDSVFYLDLWVNDATFGQIRRDLTLSKSQVNTTGLAYRDYNSCICLSLVQL